jgi:hypothetical protein
MANDIQEAVGASLIVHMAGLGDLVVALPALAALGVGRPGHRFTFATDKIINLCSAENLPAGEAIVAWTTPADAGTVSFDKASPAALWRLRVAAGAAVSAKHPPYRRCIRPITVPKRDTGALDMPRCASPSPPLPPSGPDM